ncbi:MAG: hypothetical protein P1P88_11505 [Bacteroidales bacterium]|nr:hypothetical protein [Bacteroidales bacterium]
MIEVFKTNISNNAVAEIIVQHLQNILPEAKINFDLEDCDNILRVEGNSMLVNTVAQQITALWFYCKALE